MNNNETIFNNVFRNNNTYFTLLFIFPAGVLINKISGVPLTECYVKNIVYCLCMIIFLVAEHTTTIGWGLEERLDTAKNNNFLFKVFSPFNKPYNISMIDTVRISFLTFHIAFFTIPIKNISSIEEITSYDITSSIISLLFMGWYLLTNFIWNLIISPRDITAEVKGLINKKFQKAENEVKDNFLASVIVVIQKAVTLFFNSLIYIQIVFFWFIFPIISLAILVYSCSWLFCEPKTFFEMTQFFINTKKYYSFYYFIIFVFVMQNILKAIQYITMSKLQSLRKN